MQVLLDGREGVGVRRGLVRLLERVADSARPCDATACLAVSPRQAGLQTGAACSNTRTSRGPHPHRVGEEGVGLGGEVGARGVAEVAEPLLARTASAPRGPRRRRRRRRARYEPRCSRTSRRAADQVSETSSSSSQPDDRAPPRPLARATAVEPEAPPVPGRDVAEEVDRIASRQEVPHERLAPCSDRIDSGWNCTPSSGRSTWRTPITTPSSLPRRRDEVGGQRRPHRASGSAPPRTPAAARRRPRHRRAGRRRPRRGRDAAAPTVPPYAVTSPCMPEADAQHRPGRRARSTSVPTEKSAATDGWPGPGDSTTCECRSTSAGSTSSCCTTVGRTPVTGATRCTRFHV